jgi:hypothetical protein
MVQFKKYLKIISLAASLFVISGYFSFSFTEEEEVVVSNPDLAREECRRNFDIKNNINFKNHNAIKNMPLLAQYFQSLAIVRNDINVCDNLNPWTDQVSTCRAYFDDYHGFYGRLLMAGQAIPEILSVCVNKFGLNIEECKTYASAWLKNDLSYCERVKGESRKFADCKAMISGDADSCGGSDSCLNKAAYFKAIKTLDIKECDKIKDPNVKLMCQGYIGMDEKICEKNKGFEEFRNIYCGE